MDTRATYFDQLLTGTPFRGIIIKGPVSPCAYVGVPESHWLVDMQESELEFSCHGGITFRGFGDGDYRPEGWYWYGWDYAHYGDRISYPAEAVKTMPPHLREHLQRGKEWTIPEIEQDLIDAAVELMGALNAANIKADKVVGNARARLASTEYMPKPQPQPQPSGKRARRMAFYSRQRQARRK